VTLLDFLTQKAFDHRYQNVLIEVLRVVIDMYSGVIGGMSSAVDSVVFQKVKGQVENQIEVDRNLKMLNG